MFGLGNWGWRLVATVLVATAVGLGLSKPGGTSGPSEPYVVQAGDTLWSIAASRYEGDTRKAIWRIRTGNDLGTRSILVGEVIELPAS